MKAKWVVKEACEVKQKENPIRFFDQHVEMLSKELKKELSKKLYENVKVTLSCRAACFLKLKDADSAAEDCLMVMKNFPLYLKIIDRMIDCKLYLEDEEESAHYLGVLESLLINKMNGEELGEKMSMLEMKTMFEGLEKKRVLYNEIVEKYKKRNVDYSKVANNRGSKISESEIRNTMNNVNYHKRRLTPSLFDKILNKELSKFSQIQKIGGNLDVINYFKKKCPTCLANVEHSIEFGNHLVASQDIQANDVIIIEDSLLCGTVDIENYCSNCIAPLNRDTRIPCKNKCGMEYYCSVRCRDHAFSKYHESICGFSKSNTLISTVSKGFSSSSSFHLISLKFMGMMLKIISRGVDGNTIQQVTNADLYNIKMIQMLVTCPLLENSTMLVPFPDIMMPLFGYLSYFIALQKCTKNAFGAGRANSRGVITGIQVGALINFANHSCVPNARMEDRLYKNKTTMQLIANRNIKK